MGRPYTEEEDKADYDKCYPHFLGFIKNGGMGCPQIAEKTGINYGRVSMLFSIFIRKYSEEKRK